MGEIKSREWRKKRSEKYSGEGNPNFGNRGGKNSASQSVVRISKTGEMLETYPSVGEAAGVWTYVKYQKSDTSGYFFKKEYQLTIKDWVRHYIAKLLRILRNKPLSEIIGPREIITGPKPKPLIQLTEKGKYVKTYPRAAEVLKEFNIPQSTLYFAIANKRVLRGYLWLWAKDYKKKSIASWFKK